MLTESVYDRPSIRRFVKTSIDVSCRHLRWCLHCKCWPTDDGRTMIEDYSTDYSTTALTEEIGHRCSKNYNLAQRTQNWSANQKKTSVWAKGTADELPTFARMIPFLPRNRRPLVVFWKWPGYYLNKNMGIKIHGFNIIKSESSNIIENPLTDIWKKYKQIYVSDMHIVYILYIWTKSLSLLQSLYNRQKLFLTWLINLNCNMI